MERRNAGRAAPRRRWRSSARRARPGPLRLARPAAHARSWRSSSPSWSCLPRPHGRPPLLLLDDVFSELDPDRRAHLVRRIGELPQAFVTTTTPDDLDPALVAASTAWQCRPGTLDAGRNADDRPGRRRPMRRLADVLPEVAAEPGHRERAAPGAPDGHLGAPGRGARCRRRAAPRSCCGPTAGARRQRADDRRGAGAAPALRPSCSTPSPSRRTACGCSSCGRDRPPARSLHSRRLGPRWLPGSSSSTAWSPSRTGCPTPPTHARHRADDRLEGAHQGQPVPHRSARRTSAASARRVPPRRRHDPARVLLRRVGGHPDRAREGCPQRQPQAAPVREGGGLPPGSIGIAVAVVRGNELYVATVGDADAYLVRSARLLMPEHKPGAGLPADDNAAHRRLARRVRGRRLAACCASRNLVEVVGTEELKNAVVTLHPQSAVEHLHHLFVAAGGEGSDAVLALEATEVVADARRAPASCPVSPAEPLAGAPSSSPIPLADQVAGARDAVRERAGATRSGAAATASRGAVDRVLDLMPRRATGYRRIRHRQRRGARTSAARRSRCWPSWSCHRRAGRRCLVLARSARTARSRTRPSGAAALPRRQGQGRPGARPRRHDPQRPGPGSDAAAGGVGRPRRRRARRGADATAGQRRCATGPRRAGLAHYDTHTGHRSSTRPQWRATRSSTSAPGPDGARVLHRRRPQRVARRPERPAPRRSSSRPATGSGVGHRHAAPAARRRARPADRRHARRPVALAAVRQPGRRHARLRSASPATRSGATTSPTSAHSSSTPTSGLYRLYVAYPAELQILRYEPIADGSGFSAPDAVLPRARSEPVDDVPASCSIDGDIYAVTADDVLQATSAAGASRASTLDPPPDDGDLRPGHDYRLIGATGAQRARPALRLGQQVHSASSSSTRPTAHTSSSPRRRWLRARPTSPACTSMDRGSPASRRCSSGSRPTASTRYARCTDATPATPSPAPIRSTRAARHRRRRRHPSPSARPSGSPARVALASAATHAAPDRESALTR